MRPDDLEERLRLQAAVLRAHERYQPWRLLLEMLNVVDINPEEMPILDLRRQEHLLVETEQQRRQEGISRYHLRQCQQRAVPDPPADSSPNACRPDPTSDPAAAAAANPVSHPFRWQAC
jgi:hypothetical protein